jgi:type I restriction enzyme, S subunit
MNSNWKEWRVEDLAERVAMGPFGSSIRVDTFVPNGVPVISGRHLNGSRLVEDEFNYVSLEHADRLKNSNAYRGDVVFTHAGNIGQVAVIPETSRFTRYVLSQRQFKLTPRTDIADPRFLAYYFTSPKGRRQLLANASSTGVPSIARPVTYLRSLRIFLPPIEEQRAIASVLGVLDDKIELNRRMSETLEALARAIFTSWLVDFDPVRAKADGRQPVGMDAETAALFPDSLEDSPLGPIPSGWHATELRELAKNVRDQVDPRDLDPPRPYVGLDDMPRRSIALAAWGTSADATSGKSAFRRGDVLFGKLRPYFHKVGVAPADGICSTDVLVLRAVHRDFEFAAHLRGIERCVRPACRLHIGRDQDATGELARPWPLPVGCATGGHSPHVRRCDTPDG